MLKIAKEVMMMETYQGYFQEDGQFISGNTLVKLPKLRRTIVNVLDDEYVSELEMEETSRKQRVARILSTIAQARAVENDGMNDEDWDELANIRNVTNAGLSRAVEL
jgi:hypothetical protein